MNDNNIFNMQELGLCLEEELPSLSPQAQRELSLQRCIVTLIHASSCHIDDCLPSCARMKTVLRHTQICQPNPNGGCVMCKELIALCCYHAKHCQVINCPVLFCTQIKHTLHQQQLLQGLRLLGVAGDRFEVILMD